MKNLTRYFAILPFGIALKLLMLQLFRKLFFPYMKFEFSYAGENSILNDLFNYKTSGFYIDVGCNHPIRASNTFLFYLKGWHGIAIDANESLIKEFKRIRKKDIVIHAAVSKEEKEVNFYDFGSASLLNTISDKVGVGVQRDYNLKALTKMKTKSLNSILQSSGITPDKLIDLLSIDVEGYDFEVLQSIDINLYKPNVIVIESHDFNLDKPESNNLYNYLISLGYKFIGFISMNAYFSLKR